MPPKYVPVKNQLSALGDRYPDLRKPDSNVTKAAKALYAYSVSKGQPKGPYTALRVIKRLIDVKPEFVGEAPKPKVMSEEEARVQELAKRMGVKNAEAAMQKFEKRTVEQPAPSSLLTVLMDPKYRA